MISMCQLKLKFQALLHPLTTKLHQHHITADQITLLSCISSLIITLIVGLTADYLWVFWLIILWLLIRKVLTMINDTLTHQFNQQTTAGVYYRELCGTVADSALFLIFISVNWVYIPLVIVITLLSLLTEYAGVMGPLIGASRRDDGPMGKENCTLFLGAISTLLAANWLPLPWVNPLLIILAFLLVFTLFNRVRGGIKEVRKKQKQHNINNISIISPVNALPPKYTGLSKHSSTYRTDE